MFIKQIEQFNGYEADLVVSDGSHNVRCYFSCYPPLKKLKEGMLVEEISTLLAKDINKVKQNRCLIQKGKDYYAYYLQGKVIALDRPMIDIGDLTILLDSNLPNDIVVGDYVGLKVQRLDCVLQK